MENLVYKFMQSSLQSISEQTERAIESAPQRLADFRCVEAVVIGNVHEMKQFKI